MSKAKVSASELVEQAIEELGPIRRRFVKRRMRDEKFREALIEGVLADVCEDPECPGEFKHHCESFGFEYGQAIEIDWETKLKIIKLIVQYLPALIKVLSLFLSPALLLASLFIPVG